MIGALALIILLLIESSPLALLFLSFFIPFEISSAVNCEINTLWLSFIKSRLGIGLGFFPSIFFDSKILKNAQPICLVIWHLGCLISQSLLMILDVTKTVLGCPLETLTFLCDQFPIYVY